MKHSRGHLGLRANRTHVQAHLGTSRCAQGVGAGSEARVSSAAQIQPRREGWHVKTGMARQRLWGRAVSVVSFFSEWKREAEKDKANATVAQGVSG